MYLPLAALSKDKTMIVPFTLNDGPCALNATHFILMARPGTPILCYDSIYRRLPDSNICEGSIIEKDGEEYIVKYHRGFNAISKSKKIIEVITPDLKVKGHVNIIQSDFAPIKGSLPKYEIQGQYLTFKSFYGVLKKCLLVRNKHINIVKFCYINQYAGISYEGNKAYFGTKNSDGDLLTLVDGKPKYINKKELLGEI